MFVWDKCNGISLLGVNDVKGVNPNFNTLLYIGYERFVRMECYRVSCRSAVSCQVPMLVGVSNKWKCEKSGCAHSPDRSITGQDEKSDAACHCLCSRCCGYGGVGGKK